LWAKWSTLGALYTPNEWAFDSPGIMLELVPVGADMDVWADANGHLPFPV
jgi:hypothetical protein